MSHTCLSRIPQVRLSSPFLTETELHDLAADPVLKGVRLPAFFDASGDAAGSLRKGLDALCEAADKAVKDGAELLILSDRDDNMVRCDLARCCDGFKCLTRVAGEAPGSWHVMPSGVLSGTYLCEFALLCSKMVSSCFLPVCAG